MFVIYFALPAEWIVPFSPVVGEDHRILEELVAREINVSNDVIVSHKLGHWDLFSYKSLIKVLYNSHDQFRIFLHFVVKSNSSFLEISGFYMFLQNKLFFRWSYRAQPGTSYSFLFNNLSFQSC